jgi:hypothetical protein
MEDHRDEVVVIVAGYPDEMERVHYREPGPGLPVHPYPQVRRLLRRRTG